jgi:sulfite reductase alpha subunit-like flavoprotein
MLTLELAFGRIYVCGRANTVGVGVDEALTNILTKHPIPGMGNMTPKEFLLAMRHDYRHGRHSIAL